MNQFHIRYTTLKFTVRMMERCFLPKEKASAIRGGFGNSLLDIYCIRTDTGSCERCCFCSECIVQRIMYAALKIPVPSVQEKESEGYIITCTDYKTEFYQGDTFSFSVTIFGDLIVHLQTILQAFFRLGNYGIGRERGRFEIIEIENQFGQKLFAQGEVFLENYF